MAANLKNESTYALKLYMEYIDSITQELSGFFLKCKEEHKQGLLSTNYLSRLEKQIEEKVLAHNEIMKALDEEMTKRLRKKFPTVATIRWQELLLDEYVKEKEEFNKVDEKPTIKLEIEDNDS